MDPERGRGPDRLGVPRPQRGRRPGRTTGGPRRAGWSRCSVARPTAAPRRRSSRGPPARAALGGSIVGRGRGADELRQTADELRGLVDQLLTRPRGRAAADGPGRGPAVGAGGRWRATAPPCATACAEAGASQHGHSGSARGAGAPDPGVLPPALGLLPLVCPEPDAGDHPRPGSLDEMAAGRGRGAAVARRARGRAADATAAWRGCQLRRPAIWAAPTLEPGRVPRRGRADRPLRPRGRHDRPGALAGVITIDSWAETVPSPRHTTWTAFGYDGPRARAPQAVLLVVPPDAAVALDEQAVLGAVRHARQQARARAVPAVSEPDAVPRTPRPQRCSPRATPAATWSGRPDVRVAAQAGADAAVRRPGARLRRRGRRPCCGSWAGSGRSASTPARTQAHRWASSSRSRTPDRAGRRAGPDGGAGRGDHRGVGPRTGGHRPAGAGRPGDHADPDRAATARGGAFARRCPSRTATPSRGEVDGLAGLAAGTRPTPITPPWPGFDGTRPDYWRTATLDHAADFPVGDTTLRSPRTTAATSTGTPSTPTSRAAPGPGGLDPRSCRHGCSTPVRRCPGLADRGPPVDIGGFPPDRSHLATALLIELVCDHANDWFMAPVPPPRLARAARRRPQRGVVVTLGDATCGAASTDRPVAGDHPARTSETRSPGPDEPPGPWSLFRTTGWPVRPGGVADGRDTADGAGARRHRRSASTRTPTCCGRSSCAPTARSSRPTHWRPEALADGERTGSRDFTWLPSTTLPQHWHPYRIEDHDDRCVFVQGLVADLTRTPVGVRRGPRSDLIGGVSDEEVADGASPGGHGHELELSGAQPGRAPRAALRARPWHRRLAGAVAPAGPGAAPRSAGVAPAVRPAARGATRVGRALRPRRSSAMNIASLAWRCGHSCTAPGRCGDSASTASGTRAAASSRTTSVRCSRTARTTPAVSATAGEQVA